MKILTFTPVWQRPEIFEICLQGIKRLQKYDPKRFQIQPFFVISESCAAKLLLKYKYDFVYAENAPLGAKKNTGIRYAFDNYDFDYIMEIGSDDLVTNEWLETALPLMEQNVKQFHPCDVYFVDARNGETAYWKTDKILGAGRFISREAIAQVIKRDNLWEPVGRRGMDTYSWRQLLKYGIGNKIIDTGDVVSIDIKSDVNINQMSTFKPSPLALEEILIHFPEAELIRKQIATRHCERSEAI